MKSKKAQEESKSNFIIVVLILFAVGLLIMSAFIYRFYKEEQEFARKFSCKKAIEAQTMLRIRPLDTYAKVKNLFAFNEEHPSDITCPTTEDIIKETEKAKIMSRLAYDMAECWNIFGEGTLDLFEVNTEEQKYCIICHHIIFENKEIRINATEFDSYLEKYKAPVEFDKEERPYKEYLTDVVTTPGVLDEYSNDIKTGDYDIATEDDYAVLFTYAKKGYWDKWMRGSGWAVAGIVSGAVLIPFTGGGSIAIIAGSLTAGAAGGAIAYKTANPRAADWDAGILLLPYDPEVLRRINCEYMPAQQKWD